MYVENIFELYSIDLDKPKNELITITAIKIEKTYTKSEILELYLNSVYFGHGTYGVQAASLYYFGKSVSEITLDESAILIGLLPAPARYSPISHPDRSIIRRNLVLNVMYNDGTPHTAGYINSNRLPVFKIFDAC